MKWFCVILFIISSYGFGEKNHITLLDSPKSVNPLIVIDPGHGGRDQGAQVTKPYCKEKRLALETALLVEKYLKQLGYRVILTRKSDHFIPLSKRVEIANQAKSALFVSLHYNSCPNAVAHGIEIHYTADDSLKQKTVESKKLAEMILNSLVLRTNAKNRGLKKGQLYVTRNTIMPSILVEGGFLTNMNERNNLINKTYIDKIAKSVAEGIDTYLKL